MDVSTDGPRRPKPPRGFSRGEKLAQIVNTLEINADPRTGRVRATRRNIEAGLNFTLARSWFRFALKELVHRGLLAPVLDDDGHPVHQWYVVQDRARIVGHCARNPNSGARNVGHGALGQQTPIVMEGPQGREKTGPSEAVAGALYARASFGCNKQGARVRSESPQHLSLHYRTLSPEVETGKALTFDSTDPASENIARASSDNARVLNGDARALSESLGSPLSDRNAGAGTRASAPAPVSAPAPAQQRRPVGQKQNPPTPRLDAHRLREVLVPAGADRDFLVELERGLRNGKYTPVHIATNARRAIQAQRELEADGQAIEKPGALLRRAIRENWAGTNAAHQGALQDAAAKASADAPHQRQRATAAAAANEAARDDAMPTAEQQRRKLQLLAQTRALTTPRPPAPAGPGPLAIDVARELKRFPNTPAGPEQRSSGPAGSHEAQ